MPDYEPITASGQSLHTTDYPNNTIENLLVDLSTGADFTIIPRGSDPTVRNIGFEGTYRGDGFMISIGAGFSVTGTCTIENIYLGDGCSQEGSSFTHGPGAIFLHPDSNCATNFNEVCIRGFSNNAFYMSNDSGAGRTRWENCYTVNNGVTHYRGAHGNSSIHNCVGYNDSGQRHGESFGSERFGRIVWAWSPGPIDIYDSHMAQGPAALEGLWAENGGASGIQFHSGQYTGETRTGPGYINFGDVGSSPVLQPPAGVPMTAEDAASGEGTDDPPDDGDDDDDDDDDDDQPPDDEPDEYVYENWAGAATDLDKYYDDVADYEVEAVSNQRDGTYALRANGGHARINYPEGDGPSRGTSFAVSNFPASGTENTARFMNHFAVQGSGSGDSDRYSIVADHDLGQLRFGIRENDGWTWPSSAEFDFNTTGTASQWNEVYVDFGETEPDLLSFRYETPDGEVLAEGSYSDTTFDGGGWGWSVWTGDDSDPAGWIDYLRDESTDEVEAPAPPENLWSPSQTDTTVDLTWDHSPDKLAADDDNDD